MSEPSEKSFVEHPYVQGLLLKCGEAEQMAATDEPHTEVELAIAFQAAAIAETVLDAARCGGPDAVKSALIELEHTAANGVAALMFEVICSDADHDLQRRLDMSIVLARRVELYVSLQNLIS